MRKGCPSKLVLVLVLCLGTAVGAASAQEIRPFAVDSLALHVEGGMLLDDQYQDYLNSYPQKNTERGLFETLRADILGYIYHPAFLAWQLNGGLTLKQRWLGSGTANSRTRIREVIPEYGLTAEVLRTHPLSLGFQTSRFVSFVNPSFRSAFNINHRHTGGNINWRYRSLQQTVVASHDAYDSEGQTQVDEKRRSVRYELRQQGGRLHSLVKLEYLKTDQALTQQFIETKSGRLTETMYLDDQGLRPISLIVFQQSQSGRSDYRVQDFSLWTRQPLRYGFDVQGSVVAHGDRFDGRETNTNTALATLEHQLFQSLTTTLSYAVSKPVFATGEQFDRDNVLDMRYRKRTFFGAMTLYWQYGKRQYHENFSAFSRSLVREEFTADFTLPFSILDTRVDADSIQLLDLTNPGQILLPNVDYVISQLPLSIQVILTPGGNVVQGDRLEVSYEIQVDGSYGFDESRYAYGIGLDIRHDLHISAGKGSISRILSYGNPVFVLLNDDSENVGVRWRLPLVEVSADYALVGNASNPYKRRQAGLNAGRGLSPAVNLLADASFSQTDYFDGGGGASVVTTRTGLWYTPSRRLRAETHVDYISRRGRSDDGRDLLLNLVLKYRTRVFRLDFKYARTFRDIQTRGKESRDVMSFSLLRDF